MKAHKILFVLTGWLLVACGGSEPFTPAATPMPNVHPTVVIAPTAVPVWTAQLSGAVNVTPVLSDDLVIVATDGGQIHAVAAATGVPVWTFRSETRIWDASLRVADGLACIGQEGGLLTCLDAATGEAVWTTALGIESQSRSALVNGRLYVPTTQVGTGTANDYEAQAILFALNADNGDIIWQVQTDNYILRRPVVINDLVIIGGAYTGETSSEDSSPNRIYAFDAATGQEVWVYESEDGLIRWLAAHDDVVAFAGRSEIVRALNLSNGELAWSFGPSYWMQFPTVQDGIYYLGSGDERFHALDAVDGRQLWEISIDLSSLSQIGQPLIQDDIIWLNAVTGEIYGLRLENGEQVAHLQTGISARVGGALYENLYIMGDPEGILYAFAIGE